MKNISTKLVASLLPLVLFTCVAQGAGFALYEYSARTAAIVALTFGYKF